MLSVRSKCKKGFCCSPPKSWWPVNEVIFDLLCLSSTLRLCSFILSSVKNNENSPEIDWEMVKDRTNASTAFVAVFAQ